MHPSSHLDPSLAVAGFPIKDNSFLDIACKRMGLPNAGSKGGMDGCGFDCTEIVFDGELS